jgi:hypothetical protein
MPVSTTFVGTKQEFVRGKRKDFVLGDGTDYVDSKNPDPVNLDSGEIFEVQGEINNANYGYFQTDQFRANNDTTKHVNYATSKGNRFGIYDRYRNQFLIREEAYGGLSVPNGDLSVNDNVSANSGSFSNGLTTSGNSEMTAILSLKAPDLSYQTGLHLDAIGGEPDNNYNDGPLLYFDGPAGELRMVFPDGSTEKIDTTTV